LIRTDTESRDEVLVLQTSKELVLFLVSKK